MEVKIEILCRIFTVYKSKDHKLLWNRNLYLEMGSSIVMKMHFSKECFRHLNFIETSLLYACCISIYFHFNVSSFRAHHNGQKVPTFTISFVTFPIFFSSLFWKSFNLHLGNMIHFYHGSFIPYFGKI